MVLSLHRFVSRCLPLAVAAVILLWLPCYSDERPEDDAGIRAPIPLEASGVIPFQSDAYRYQNRWLVPRALSSLVSCSLGILEWDGSDWFIAGMVTASTASLMVPMGGLSADTRLYYRVRDMRDDDVRCLFPDISSVAWGCIIASWTALWYGTGWIAQSSAVMEYISLTLEAVGLTQFYHVTFKLLLGREGPPQGHGGGTIHGPARSLELFPYGTPSGHIATLYAMTTVAAEYLDSWVLRILSHVAAAYYAVNLIYNDAHFASDIIWGASIGYYVARWVVKHRSSRFTYRDGAERSGGSGGAMRSEGEITAYPFYNTGTKSVNLCVRYSF
ncbi:MAG: phosphatase PAP2 family protein [Spirochaetes bacterium]|nr:phosphatase PAP2 family protein [Spirochaetota bacterium]